MELLDNGVHEKRVYYRKFRSITRKKRKVFAGTRKKACPQSTVGTESIGQGCFDCNQGTPTLSSAAVRYFRKMDSIRLKDAAIKVSKKYKDRWQQVRAIKKKRLDFKEKSYLSGAFGLCSLPENIPRRIKEIASKAKKGRNKGRRKVPEKRSDTPSMGVAYSSQSEPAVTFLMPLEVLQNFQE